MYYNTINATQPELPLYEDRTKKQDELVLSIFQEHKGDWLTPPYVHSLVKARTGRDCPLTSIRRSITTLSTTCQKRGLTAKLIKSAIAVSKGLYGVPNHSWTLKI